MTPHPVDRRPRIGELILGAIQHVGAMYAGVVAPPLVIGAAVGLGPAQLSLPHCTGWTSTCGFPWCSASSG